MTLLTKIGVQFVWTENNEKAFRELKQRLTLAPVLIIMFNGQPSVIYSDASPIEISGVLMQNVGFVSYTLRLMKSHNRNYLHMTWS